MITYTFIVRKQHPEFPVPWPEGHVIEVELPIRDYDEFKAKYEGYLERYFVDAPAHMFVSTVTPDGRFMERLNTIKHNYPGAQNMFDNAKWSPKREF